MFYDVAKGTLAVGGRRGRGSGSGNYILHCMKKHERKPERNKWRLLINFMSLVNINSKQKRIMCTNKNALETGVNCFCQKRRTGIG